MDTSKAISRGELALKKAPAVVEQMQCLIESSFNYTSLKDVESRFTEQVNKSQRTPSENKELNALLSSVRDEITQAVNLLLALKFWIKVQVPKIEDGNNFGVSVQLDTIKALEDLVTPAVKTIDDLPSYFDKRVAAWEKVSVNISKETKKSTSGSKEIGGKDGDVSKTSESSSTEEKQSESSSPPDAFQYIIAHDLKWYVSLHHALVNARDAVILASDKIDKNMEKLTRPKGTNTQGGSMYTF